MLVCSILVLVAIGVIGFVALSDIRPDRAPSIDPTPGPIARSGAGTIAVVTTDALNVRDGASIDAAVIDTLSQGARLEVFGESRNGFTPIRYGTGQGWMATEFLTVDVDNSSEVPEDLGQSKEPPGDGSVTDVPTGEVLRERWIDVDRSTGVVILYEGLTIVATYVGKTGQDASADGFFATAPGTYYVFSMNEQLAETPFAEGVYLTHWVGFDPDRSNGFHSPARDALGNVQLTQDATTLGCVRLDADAAAEVFDFSFIGMRVDIHD